jgi:fructose-specific phosphotransferase system IIB component
MKIVGVSSCSLGIAHTYMAAEVIEKYFRKLGHEVKIERDGSLGPENIVTEREISSSDVIVLALSGDLYNPERFENYENKIIKVSADDGVRKPEKILKLMKDKGIYKE